MIVDAHLHVFRAADAVPRVVDPLVPPERQATVEDLLGVMAGAGIDRAVLVPLADEDAYVGEARRDHAGRFAAVLVADATVQGRAGDDALEALAARGEVLPYDAVRTRSLGDPARPLAESPMLPVPRHLATPRARCGPTSLPSSSLLAALT